MVDGRLYHLLPCGVLAEGLIPIDFTFSSDHGNVVHIPLLHHKTVVDGTFAHRCFLRLFDSDLALVVETELLSGIVTVLFLIFFLVIARLLLLMRWSHQNDGFCFSKGKILSWLV